MLRGQRRPALHPTLRPRPRVPARDFPAPSSSDAFVPGESSEGGKCKWKHKERLQREQTGKQTRGEKGARPVAYGRLRG